MNSNGPLTEEQQQNLVAYLDGELSDAAAAEIEQLLVDSPEARREIEELTRTWKLLDQLPQVRASETFTQSTMATIAVGEKKPKAKPARAKSAPPAPVEPEPSRHAGAVLAVWGAALVAAAACGFMATNQWTPDSSQMLLRELPVVENLDRYSEIGSLEYLEELRRSGVLNDNNQR